MRPLSACIACRDRRKKCIRARRGVSCNFCISRRIECSFLQPTPELNKKTYKPLVTKKDGRPRISSSGSLDPELGEELINLFFQHNHTTYPSLFHPASFKRDFKNGSLPKILYFAVISLSARFSSHPSLSHIHPWDRGRPYANEAEGLLNLHDTSITTIQACVLLGIAAVTEGEPETESVFYSIAYRMAILLGLPDATADSWLEREIQSRVWWTLFTLDTWNSAAMCISRTIQIREDVKMPTNELKFLHYVGDDSTSDAYENGSPTSTPESLDPESRFSLLGHKAQLNLILHRIHKLNMSIVGDVSDPSEAAGLVDSLASSLNDWIQAIPDEWQASDANLQYWSNIGMGPQYISLHIDYNNACQILFFRYLHLCQTSSLDADTGLDLPRQYAQRCQLHAAYICDLVFKSNHMPETKVLYALAGHILSIASAVQIYTLLFSLNEDEISDAIRRLEYNFQHLMQLHTYWPNVSTSLSRLRAFHNACMKEKVGSFCLDRWMLRYLMEFSRPIREKDDEDEESKNDHSFLWSMAQLWNALELQPRMFPH